MYVWWDACKTIKHPIWNETMHYEWMVFLEWELVKRFHLFYWKAPGPFLGLALQSPQHWDSIRPELSENQVISESVTDHDRSMSDLGLDWNPHSERLIVHRGAGGNLKLCQHGGGAGSMGAGLAAWGRGWQHGGGAGCVGLLQGLTIKQNDFNDGGGC